MSDEKKLTDLLGPMLGQAMEDSITDGKKTYDVLLEQGFGVSGSILPAPIDAALKRISTLIGEQDIPVFMAVYHRLKEVYLSKHTFSDEVAFIGMAADVYTYTMMKQSPQLVESMKQLMGIATQTGGYVVAPSEEKD